jgi:hypothetical protein
MSEQKDRPVFLLVLCILSFVGIAFNLLSELYYILLPNAALQAAQQSESMMGSLSESSGVFAFLKNMSGSSVALAEHARIFGTTTLLLSLISLAGVILMFKLKKIGFYIYSGSNIVLIFAPIVLAGSAAITGISLGLSIFFAVLFILLYALNLKAMK